MRGVRSMSALLPITTESVALRQATLRPERASYREV